MVRFENGESGNATAELRQRPDPGSVSLSIATHVPNWRRPEGAIKSVVGVTGLLVLLSKQSVA